MSSIFADNSALVNSPNAGGWGSVVEPEPEP
jgi:hypothetical protein